MDGAFPSVPGQGGYGGGRGRGRGFRGTAENAKTKLCTRWLQGDCRFGDRCNFAHGEHELRKLPDGPPPAGGRGYGAPRGRGYGYGGRGSPGGGRGYGYGGRGGYQGGYGMEQGQQGGYDRAGAAPGQSEDVWAAQGYPVAGPNGWYMYRTKENGECYYHNHRNNVTQWERPADWPAGAPQM
mmetsp:Transcript_38110/g.84913  ORF Transcript_38110/g.84913 Transcript_38110/m.84913 type:complete len:182 (+) Transcript_38110:186-731(+)|eukprot:CAMPEP_0202897282 /NCGR_PEP_ID=MMETSP1392-20130828/6079_1 /ASSEMBLY_ACC=CAM_ASM_000868 /TAXON_ID=225041 /ORGANISM="Chlamydomonas chlamydogama, Strain SAG 11-48b" /LENGTH=181 /DNA_ID=CAMNT_0049582881 /DNA_START=163 /DNA_END=708 /DNA_ORIENTATION=-